MSKEPKKAPTSITSPEKEKALVKEDPRREAREFLAAGVQLPDAAAEIAELEAALARNKTFHAELSESFRRAKAKGRAIVVGRLEESARITLAERKGIVRRLRELGVKVDDPFVKE